MKKSHEWLVIILAHNEDFPGLRTYFETLKEIQLFARIQEQTLSLIRIHQKCIETASLHL